MFATIADYLSNLSNAVAVPIAGTAYGVLKESRGVVHGVIVGSNTAGSYRFWDTATKPSIGITGSAVGGTFFPQSYSPTASGSSVIMFSKPMIFENGIAMSSTSGLADSLVLLN